MEHTISHLLEMAAKGRNALHGAQVGVATVVAALTWRHVRRRIAQDGMHLRFPDTAQMRRRVEAAFDPLDPTGAMSRECMADYDAKLTRWHDSRGGLAGLPAAWSGHERTLDGLLVDPVRMVEALRKAGAPLRFGQLDPPVDPGTARWAVANCHLMRDRFTVADLACFLGAWTDEDVDAVLAEASTMDAGL
jgi:glycerol-1-phosphate dehydrogenase [NAD(P)+]